MRRPEKPATDEKTSPPPRERQPYEPPRVQSVKLSDEAAESLT